jgi:hypothetical protein
MSKFLNQIAWPCSVGSNSHLLQWLLLCRPRHVVNKLINLLMCDFGSNAQMQSSRHCLLVGKGFGMVYMSPENMPDKFKLLNVVEYVRERPRFSLSDQATFCWWLIELVCLHSSLHWRQIWWVASRGQSTLSAIHDYCPAHPKLTLLYWFSHTVWFRCWGLGMIILGCCGQDGPCQGQRG